jgi:hypothetical protein
MVASATRIYPFTHPESPSKAALPLCLGMWRGCVASVKLPRSTVIAEGDT